MSKQNKQQTNTTSMETLWKVLRFIGKYRFLLVLSIILAAVSVILQLYVPVLFGNAIDQVVAKREVNFRMMWYYLSRILVMIIVSSVATWIMNIINNRMTFRTVQDIRAKAIRHIQVLPLSYLDSHSTGDIISRVIADTDILSDGLLLGFTQLFSGIVTIIGTLLFMFSKNIWITLMVIVLTPLSFFVAKFISSRSFHMFRKQSDARGRQTALIEEMIGNQKIVQAFGYEDKSSGRFALINEELKECSQKAVFYSSLTNPSTRFVNNVIYAGVALAGAFMIPGGSLTVGGLSVLLAYANQYMKPFNDISSVITELQSALACAARIFALLEEEPESADSKDTITDVRGEVNIDNVCFRYVPDKKLIENFNLHAEPGKRIAIVGPTGCGKTTFINLLMRFYDVTSGTISIDGHPINEISRHSLRSSFGMVLQDTWIKNGTVRENLNIGKPDATDEEIWEALKTAQAEEFIRAKEGGLDANIEQGGRNLSGGQRQRLTIARALVKKPRVLILDDSASALDYATDAALRKAIRQMEGAPTVFIVSQRTSSLMSADRILVLDDGEATGYGTHEELLKNCQTYREIYNSQYGKKEEA